MNKSEKDKAYLSVRGVSKHYDTAPDPRMGSGGLRVLDNISFFAKKGEFVTIVGPNGCGKSTFFRMLSDIEEMDYGKIRIGGKSIQQAKIGYVFQNYRESLLNSFTDQGKPFLLVELGAGDGLKTKLLLRYFHHVEADFTYLPIDISGNVLNVLRHELSRDLPGLEVRSYQGDYFDALDQLNRQEDGRKVLMFLGSSIGNFNQYDALTFLKEVNKRMNRDDQLLIGFDLKKDPHIILRAYNDDSGITARFNLNLLNRINKELDGEFILENFYHYPIYNPLTGETRSFLISKLAQSVRIGYLNEVFPFKMGEPISMEISQKYDGAMMRDVAEKAGFTVEKNYYDNKKYFVDSLWKKH